MKSVVLVFLGVLFVINVFFRVRLMKLFKSIKEHSIQIQFKDLLSSEKFSKLIEERYPEHSELLLNYRKSMITGLGLLVIVLLGLITYILIQP